MGLGSRISALFGRSDEDGLSVPPLDGVLKPNQDLDAAERLFDIPLIDNLIAADGALYCSSGNTLLRLDLETRRSETVRVLAGPITAIAVSPEGRLAVAVEGAGVSLLAGSVDDDRQLAVPGEYGGCITALLFEAADLILMAIGSRKHRMSEWKRDLMSHGATGAVIRHHIPSSKTEVMRGGLAFPYGLAFGNDGDILVSESWRHRILSLRTGKNLLAELPAYPARLSPATGGGYWLALFAPRRQLTELVLREDDYRLEMMATIPPDAWIGPDFSDGGNEEQPLQSGSVRQMGIMKPWAPSRSYGLVVRLDAEMAPVASHHSRADGHIHGVASVVERDGALYVASRGAGALVRLHLEPGAST